MDSARILIIEDDPFEAEHLKLHLQAAGHRIVEEVATGEAAIACARQCDIDLMLVDILLAGEIDGIEAVRQILEFLDIPVIFLTAHSNEDLLKRAESTNPYAYLLKPYRQKELEFMIKLSLIRVQIEKELKSQKNKSEKHLTQAHAIIEHTNEGILMTDDKDVIISVNPAFTRITGYSPEEAIGQRTTLLSSGKHDHNFFSKMWDDLSTIHCWQGEIWNQRKNGELYPEWLTINPILDAGGNPTHYIGIFSDISSIKQSEADLKHLAHHDPLTQLPNRLLLLTRLRYTLRNASRNKKNCAVLYIDLDRFKLINDSLGHEVGDAVLKAVSERFKLQMRQADMIARLGGDEFVVLLDSIENPVDASLVAEKLINSLKQPFRVNEYEFSMACSIGIAIYPKDGNTVEDLLRDADSAMYQAKAKGTNQIVFYTEDLTQQAFERIQLNSDLNKAITHKEFELYYQPQIDIKTGHICSAEALIRWNHPEKGLIKPDQFIHETENSGLIMELGEWIIHTACQTMQEWLDQGIDIGKIAVNIAGPQVERNGLRNLVDNALLDTGLAPQRLELELTETFSLELKDSHTAVINSLQARGISIAIDDFGTGSSTMTRLKKLNINKIKIDRTFVQNILNDKNDMAISRAIIALGNTLELEVVAEGVETVEQKQFLLNEGCQQAQGDLFSKALPAHTFIEFVHKHKLQTC